ncbi:MAG: GNAT family N-acetyltransferase [Marmoricola sp.]
MELRKFGPDDAGAIRLAVEIENAHHAVDCPWLHPLTVYRQEMEMRHGWDGETGSWFLAYDAGVPVGLLSLDTSEWDNRDLAWLGVAIHPAHRRRGHGTRALSLLQQLAAQMGRSLVGIDGWDAPGVHAFADATGFARKSQAIHRRLHYADVDLDVVRALRDGAAGAAAAYELVGVTGHTPGAMLGAVAGLSAAINDAPTDDLEYEDEVYPPERIRDYEDAQAEAGFRLHRLLARHRESGELVGHTVVALDSERPTQSEQHDTSVVAAHRGHRLGLLLKAEMILRLAYDEPQLELVDTWNAESNLHMIGVNDQRGYRALGRELAFQRRL